METERHPPARKAAPQETRERGFRRPGEAQDRFPHVREGKAAQGMPQPFTFRHRTIAG